MHDLSNQRLQYGQQSLLESTAHRCPFTQFELWFNNSKNSITEPYAFSLATCGNDMRPNSRVLLLRSFDTDGFIFYTHYNSPKGNQLSDNPNAQMLFFWPALEQQVRISGRIKPVDSSTSDRYFALRPRNSQLAAYASKPQSGPIGSKDALLEQFSATEQQFAQLDTIPRPGNWGGYCLVPDSFEFWQGGADRLHDRLLYSQQGQAWHISRLMP